MKRKQHIQSFLSACSVQLQDIHDMQENVRQSNFQLVFLQTKKPVSFTQEHVLLSLN